MYSTACAFSSRMKSRKSAGNDASAVSFGCPHARDSSLRRRCCARNLGRAVCALESCREARRARDRRQSLGRVRGRWWRHLLRQRRLLTRPAFPPRFRPGLRCLAYMNGPRFEGDRDVDEVQKSYRRFERHIRSHPPLELTDQPRTSLGHHRELGDGQTAPLPGCPEGSRERIDRGRRGCHRRKCLCGSLHSILLRMFRRAYGPLPCATPLDVSQHQTTAGACSAPTVAQQSPLLGSNQDSSDPKFRIGTAWTAQVIDLPSKRTHPCVVQIHAQARQ